MQKHPDYAQAGSTNCQPSHRRKSVTEEETGKKCGNQGSKGHDDENIGHGGQGNCHHEGGKHYGPAYTGDPNNLGRIENPAPKAPPPHCGQSNGKRQSTKGAAPESYLKAQSRVQVPRYNTGHAPE